MSFDMTVAPGSEFQDARQRVRAVLAAAGRGDTADETVREIVHAVAAAFGILIGRAPTGVLTADEVQRVREKLQRPAPGHPTVHITNHFDDEQVVAALSTPAGREAFQRAVRELPRDVARERLTDAADFARAEDGSLVAPFHGRTQCEGKRTGIENQLDDDGPWSSVVWPGARPARVPQHSCGAPHDPGDEDRRP